MVLTMDQVLFADRTKVLSEVVFQDLEQENGVSAVFIEREQSQFEGFDVISLEGVVVHVVGLGGHCEIADGKIGHNLLDAYIGFLDPVLFAFFQGHDVCDVEVDACIERDVEQVLALFFELVD